MTRLLALAIQLLTIRSDACVQDRARTWVLCGSGRLAAPNREEVRPLEIGRCYVQQVTPRCNDLPTTAIEFVR